MIIEDGYQAQRDQFIHPRASDHAAGAELLTPGKRITRSDIAILASAGLLGDLTPAVSRKPSISIISTGNELVAPGIPIEPHQIRLSNGPAIKAMLGQHGYDECAQEHLIEVLDTLRERIAAHLDNADVLILSGGVSMGKADFVPQVLADLGVKVVFHRMSSDRASRCGLALARDNKPYSRCRATRYPRWSAVVIT